MSRLSVDQWIALAGLSVGILIAFVSQWASWRRDRKERWARDRFTAYREFLRGFEQLTDTLEGISKTGEDPDGLLLTLYTVPESVYDRISSEVYLVGSWRASLVAGEINDTIMRGVSALELELADRLPFLHGVPQRWAVQGYRAQQQISLFQEVMCVELNIGGYSRVDRWIMWWRVRVQVAHLGRRPRKIPLQTLKLLLSGMDSAMKNLEKTSAENTQRFNEMLNGVSQDERARIVTELEALAANKKSDAVQDHSAD